jgi:hypothetical protein
MMRDYRDGIFLAESRREGGEVDGVFDVAVDAGGDT